LALGDFPSQAVTALKAKDDVEEHRLNEPDGGVCPGARAVQSVGGRADCRLPPFLDEDVDRLLGRLEELAGRLLLEFVEGTDRGDGEDEVLPSMKELAVNVGRRIEAQRVKVKEGEVWVEGSDVSINVSLEILGVREIDALLQ
jgi:hypothetical protein